MITEDDARRPDLEGLVQDGHLDLGALYARSYWRHVDTHTTYVACCFGRDGDQPGEVELLIETTEEYGITAYRFRENDGNHIGDPRLDESDARADADEYADESDETPDIDTTIGEIIGTGYFGAAADVDDIRSICEALCGHSQGYLLLPRGEVPAQPIGRLWTTNGYLQCEHVRVDATHDKIELAASSLLSAVSFGQEGA